MEGRVLHVAAEVDERAVDLLRRTARVIASAGVDQVFVLLGRGPRAKAGALADSAAELRLVDCEGHSIPATVRALQTELAAAARERGVYAVHFHGLRPCLLGWRALRGGALQRRVLYSPHLAGDASPWTAVLLRQLGRDFEPAGHATATAFPADAHALSRLLNRSAEVLPQPVEDAYFAAPRLHDPRPRVLAEGPGAHAVRVASRLSVLLNSREARVPFAWTGGAAAPARAELESAGIDVPDLGGDAEKAQALARGSVFLHIAPEDASPAPAAQAMAAGLPCLASDTPVHRHMIRHGETGFICTSERDFLDRLVALLRDRRERERVGAAARAEARRCFTLRHFESALLRAYGLPPARPPEAAEREAHPFPPGSPMEAQHERSSEAQR